MPARTPSRFTRTHLPVLAWAVFTAVALAAPGDALPQWSDEVWLGPWLDPVLDKVLHFILFAVLAALAARSFRALDPNGRGRALARHPLLAAVLAATAYGALSELAQLWFTTRTAEVADFGADVAGVLCAAGLVWITRRHAVAEQAAEDSSDVAATGESGAG
jgi:VanZ family protein